MICLLAQDLWGHVIACPPRTVKETITTIAFNLLRQAKVSKLDFLLRVEKEVFDLNVSVNNALLMHMMNTSHHLSEEDFALVFWERAISQQEVEKTATCGKLLHNVSNPLCVAIFVKQGAAATWTLKADNIFMLKMMAKIEFLTEHFLCGCTNTGRKVEDLDGNFSTNGTSWHKIKSSSSLAAWRSTSASPLKESFLQVRNKFNF